MTQKQREQAAGVLEKFQKGIYGHGGKVGVAIDTAIAALRGAQPDPDTGIMRCGCGGKAVDNDAYTYGWGLKCQVCGMTTEAKPNKALAKDDWNRAMSGGKDNG